MTLTATLAAMVPVVLLAAFVIMLAGRARDGGRPTEIADALPPLVVLMVAVLIVGALAAGAADDGGPVDPDPDEPEDYVSAYRTFRYTPDPLPEEYDPVLAYEPVRQWDYDIGYVVQSFSETGGRVLSFAADGSIIYYDDTLARIRYAGNGDGGWLDVRNDVTALAVHDSAVTIVVYTYGGDGNINGTRLIDVNADYVATPGTYPKSALGLVAVEGEASFAGQDGCYELETTDVSYVRGETEGGVTTVEGEGKTFLAPAVSTAVPDIPSEGYRYEVIAAEDQDLLLDMDALTEGGGGRLFVLSSAFIVLQDDLVSERTSLGLTGQSLEGSRLSVVRGQASLFLAGETDPFMSFDVGAIAIISPNGMPEKESPAPYSQAMLAASSTGAALYSGGDAEWAKTMELNEYTNAYTLHDGFDGVSVSGSGPKWTADAAEGVTIYAIRGR